MDGKRGEQLALQFLAKAGYRIVAANFFGLTGEIDLIAAKDGYIVFAEVKTRKTDAFGLPQEFVSRSKQIKIRRTAEEWLQKNPGCRLQPRFDVIAVIAPDGGYNSVQIEHIENAF